MRCMAGVRSCPAVALARALVVLALALPARAQDAGRATPPDDAAVRRAWSFLLPEEQAEAVEWFRLEARALDTFQQGLARFAIDSADVDAGFWPVEPARRWFDPATHAPKQPIPRRALAPDSAAARKMLDTVREVRPARELEPGWIYDWATGGLLRRVAPDENARVFANALKGIPPDADLAEALVLRMLDAGDQRVALTAFEHAYTDRDGNVFPLSLYDAWSAGVELEMPDVDTLGIAHDVLGEKRRWVAPVPQGKQKSLYDAIGAAFSDARRYRGLREALASCYVNAAPVLRDGYGESLVRFHALWDKHRSTPAELAAALPRDAEAWVDFQSKWSREVGKQKALRDAGLTRQATLAADAVRVRAALVYVLRELGAFERTARPQPKPAPVPPEPGPEPPPKPKPKPKDGR
jgi:hypothetical protein